MTSSRRSRRAGQLAHETGDPVVKIGTKLTKVYLCQQVPIGRAHQPKIGPVPCVPTHTFVGVFLNNTEQLRLQGQRQFPNLVKKQGAAVCERKGTVALGHCACKRTSFMTKELASGQLGHDRGAV